MLYFGHRVIVSQRVPYSLSGITVVVFCSKLSLWHFSSSYPPGLKLYSDCGKMFPVNERSNNPPKLFKFKFG